MAAQCLHSIRSDVLSSEDDKRTHNSSDLRGTLHIPGLGVQSLRFAGLGLPAGIQHGMQVPHQRNYELNVLLPQVAELRSSGCAYTDLTLMLLCP